MIIVDSARSTTGCPRIDVGSVSDVGLIGKIDASAHELTFHLCHACTQITLLPLRPLAFIIFPFANFQSTFGANFQSFPYLQRPGN